MSETVSEITKLWDLVLDRCRIRVNDAKVYESIFDKSYIDRIEGKTVHVVASTSIASMILKSKYQELISQALLEVTGTDFTPSFSSVDQAGLNKAKDQIETKQPFFPDAELNPRLSFENFVVGDSNRQAYQAALMIARNPGKMFNPLLLYSDSGLGKTHLLHAIGNAIVSEKPSLKVLCVSAAEFVDEYIKFATGYKENQTMSRWFKSEVDVFLVDDIQLLTRGKKTMEMFFVVFADLISKDKQIVITSDTHPNLLDGMDERLKTRFSQGLVLSLEKPDLQTSEEILRRKIVASGMSVDDFDPEVISTVARRFSRNVRELEGALNKLIFTTIDLKHSGRITAEIAAQAVSGLDVSSEPGSKLTESRIIAVVADYYNLTPSQITGKIRVAQIAMARHIAMYLDKTLLGTPFTKIGQTFGGKDHVTVMRGVEKVENSLKTDPDMQKAVKDLKAKLNR